MNITTIEHEDLREVIRRSRRRNWLGKHRWSFLVVGFPTLLAGVYYGLVASPVYVSQSSFVIKSPGQKGAPSLSLANLVQTTGLSSGQEQTKEVVEYLRSRNALKNLEAGMDIGAVYSSRRSDFLSGFPGPFREASFENLYRYYTSVVGADTDAESGLAILQVEAFTPDDAYRINAKLLDLSEALVNRLNERAEGRAVQEAEQRVFHAEDRVRNARIAISSFRNQQDLIDPAKQAAGVLEVSNKLVIEQAGLKSQLQLMERVTPRNPSIPALRNKVLALGLEIAAQNGKVVGTPSGIASKLGNYEKLQVEEEFATQMLTAANAALETARADAQKQQFYLERIVEPNKADEATLPHRLKSILIVLASAVCLYFIGWMVVVGILEHSPDD